MDYCFQFLKQFEEFNRQYQLISANDRIVVAVSGGLDSVALLFCLHQLAPRYGLKLLAAHFNHCLRGREADQDESFVVELAAAMVIPCESDRGDVRGFARKNRVSLEMAARELRYQFLEQVRQKNQFNKIATGHQADDQAETLLLHLLRGTGWCGLAGIPVRRQSIIRPLLFAHRHELEKLVNVAGLSYRTDHTNETMDFRRNRIRLQLLPLLQTEFNPQIKLTLNQLSTVFREGEQYLSTQAAEAFTQCLRSQSPEKIILEIERFCGYFYIIQKYVLFRLIAEVQLPQHVLSFRRLTAILAMIQQRRSGHSLPLTNHWRIGVDHTGIVLFREKFHEPVHFAFWIGATIPVPTHELRLTSERSASAEVTFTADPNIEYIDAGRLPQANVILRSVRRGDRFMPLGVVHKQKISDYFIDHKVPIPDRRRALVVCNGDEIIWLCGFRLDERYKVTDKTREIIKLQVIHD